MKRQDSNDVQIYSTTWRKPIKVFPGNCVPQQKGVSYTRLHNAYTNVLPCSLLQGIWIHLIQDTQSQLVETERKRHIDVHLYAWQTWFRIFPFQKMLVKIKRNVKHYKEDQLSKAQHLTKVCDKIPISQQFLKKTVEYRSRFMIHVRTSIGMAILTLHKKLGNFYIWIFFGKCVEFCQLSFMF